MIQNDVAIELKDVSKFFKNLVATDHLSLKIFKGEYVALLGPNGAGKTTLVEMIEGIQKPDSGEIFIFGKDWLRSELEIRKKIGFSLQETRFIDKLSVLETLKLFFSFYYLPHDKCYELLTLTGLEEKKDTFVKNLSGGQKQKLALCIALAHSPEILILDEPTTGLDPSARREIWNIILSLKSKGTTLILTTHYLEEAEFLCERILIMDRGSFIAQGRLEELLKEYNMHEVIEFSTDGEKLNHESLKSIRGVLNFQENQNTQKGILMVEDIIISLPEFLKIVKKSNVKLKSLECRKQDLDDLFLSMTGRALDE